MGIQGGNAPVKDPAANAATEEQTYFADRDTHYSKLIKGHYLKNNLFFFVGCLCAVVAGSKDYCVILIYLVLGLRTGELAGLHFGLLWVSYACHFVSVVFNYTHMITAIYFYASG